jgi:5-oxoprolinase (ATP-hydrolysing)
MTNTRITDPEIFEHRYPVRLDRFEIRAGSGGNGKFKGGDGIIREITFLEPVSLSVLTQHRSERPYGLEGGEEGQCGEQYIERTNEQGKVENVPLKGIDGLDVNAGDKLVIKTPGGGGFGKPEV